MGTRAVRMARSKARADAGFRQAKYAPTFKLGDRVRYIGGLRDAQSSLVNLSSMAGVAGMFCLTGRREARDAKGPWLGLRGRVLVLPEESTKKARDAACPCCPLTTLVTQHLVGVRFDHQFHGGGSLDKRCEPGHGYYVQPHELRLENTGDRVDEAHAAAIDALFEVIKDTMAKGPLVVFIKDVDKTLLDDSICPSPRFEQVSHVGSLIFIHIALHSLASGSTPSRDPCSSLAAPLLMPDVSAQQTCCLAALATIHCWTWD